MADLIEYENNLEFLENALAYEDLPTFLLKHYPNFLKEYHTILSKYIIVDMFDSFDEDLIKLFWDELKKIGINKKDVLYDEEHEYAVFKTDDWYLIKLCNLELKFDYEDSQWDAIDGSKIISTLDSLTKKPLLRF